MNTILLLIKIEHPSLCREGCSIIYFFIVTIDVFILNTNKCENFIGFIVRVINQRY